MGSWHYNIHRVCMYWGITILYTCMAGQFGDHKVNQKLKLNSDNVVNTFVPHLAHASNRQISNSPKFLMRRFVTKIAKCNS